MADLDRIDLTLIELLQTDARMSQAALAKQVGLAPSSVNERIRKLCENGIISGYHAHVSPDAMGYQLLAFLYVGWDDPAVEPRFLAAIAGEQSVIEAHHVTGAWNYMLKVRVKNARAYDTFYQALISEVRVHNVTALLSMEEIKSTTMLPLG